MSIAPASPLLLKLREHRGMLVPLLFVGLLFGLLVPLPTGMMDILLTLNLALSAIVLMTTMYVQTPLEFSVFPSLLLGTTLFRLVLNAATTRLILTAGDRYSDPTSALHAAGEVVLTFSQLVARGSLVVGVILFVIIFVIQFIVITKGAGRISEVAARFTLDALPGKQMAIDADLNSGLIDEAEARRRRQRVGQEADFYGAMDGAGKFLRGDAIAGILILLVNIAGGLYVGLVEQGWSFSDCAKLYTRLTIGDGLVASVPAFITSLAAGLIITRTSSRSNLGEEMLTQVLAKPRALALTAVFLVLMALTGMPVVPLLVLGCGCAGLAYVLGRSQKQQAAASTRPAATSDESQEVRKLLDIDAMELEIGFGLVRLVDVAKGGDLLQRVAAIRRRVASELGIIVPPIRIHDNPALQANDYLIKLRGQTIARGVTYPEQFLAMDHGARGAIPGAEATTDPTFGLPAWWITESQTAQAQALGYDLVDAASVLETHLVQTIRLHAHELLSRQDVRALLDHLRLRLPALVEEVVPAQVKLGELQRVLQLLLRERVPVRDLEMILQTISDHAGRSRDPEVLAAAVRMALARTLCQQYVDDANRLWCLTVDPALEDLIAKHLQTTEQGTVSSLPPGTARQIVAQVAQAAGVLTGENRPAVVVCSPQVRPALARLIEVDLPQVAVLGYNEIIPQVAVQPAAMVGLTAAPTDVAP
jgi:flagellar biosynthesis protein FlhA